METAISFQITAWAVPRKLRDQRGRLHRPLNRDLERWNQRKSGLGERNAVPAAKPAGLAARPDPRIKRHLTVIDADLRGHQKSALGFSSWHFRREVMDVICRQ